MVRRWAGYNLVERETIGLVYLAGYFTLLIVGLGGLEYGVSGFRVASWAENMHR